jgi:DNA repair exonuclease SbcCD nuclease subunit
VKFLLLSDVHGTDKLPVARKDDIWKTFDFKFSYILNYAREHAIPILQAGDLSDKSRNWNVLDYFINKLNKRIKFMSVFGQHDMYYRSNPNVTPSTLLTLIKTGFITPLSTTPTSVENVDIYGANWGDEIPEPKNQNKRNVLVIHAPISLREEWSGQVRESPKRLAKKYPDFDLILTGDIHRKFLVAHGHRFIANTGPMLRLEATEYNLRHKPCFFVWDSDGLSVKKVIIPHRPAIEVLTRDHIDKTKMSKVELKDFVKKLKSLPPIKEMRKKTIKRHVEKVKDPRVKEIVMEVING